jgi:hypothetical protein
MRINPYKKFHGSFMPEWLLPRKKISAGAKLCYARLARFSGKNGKCYPKIEKIADALGVSKRQCKTYLKELRDQQLIESEQQGLGKPNQYFFLDHQWMNPHLNDSDRGKYASLQGGSILPDKGEASCTTRGKDTSLPYNKDLRESYEESHEKRQRAREGNSENKKAPVQASITERIDGAAEIQELVQIYREYRRELGIWDNNFTLDAQHYKFRELGKERVKAALKHTISNGWKKLVEPEGKKGSSAMTKKELAETMNYTGVANAGMYELYEG